MIRWYTWQIYLDSAVTSLRALIVKFNHSVDGKKDLDKILNTLDYMYSEFIEFYDLELSEYFYKEEYSKLKSLLNLDGDYKHLQDKFSTTKENQLLREQRLINKLLIALTLATVSVSIFSTLAQMKIIEIDLYIIISFCTATLLVWLVYLLFDPIKEIYEIFKTKFLDLFKR